ncbi:Bug family tripartite tricarboxylate transporter substrate binding protein [Paralcaligenes ginsengisoli]
MRRKLYLGMLLALFSTCAQPVYAGVYPAKPIRMIVPYSAGGGIDTAARLFANGMSKVLGQAIIVENKPGAGGMIGAETVARSDPDGYTLLFAGNSELTIGPQLYPKATYDPIKSFTPIMLVAESPTVIVGNPSLKAATLRDALELGRRDPALLSVGTAGIGTPHHCALEALKHLSGVSMMHVPYKGAAPATIDVLSGQVNMAIVGAPPVLPYIRSGKLKAFAVLQPRRSALLPDVPTAKEATGLDGLDIFATWYGLLSPSRTPSAVTDALQQAAKTVLGQAEVREKMAKLGTEVQAIPGAQFAARIRTEAASYKELIQRYGIKPN